MARFSNPNDDAYSVVNVACHVHSTWSYDGKWKLADLAKEFGHRGYHAILITEHDLGFDSDRLAALRAACVEASTNEVLLIPGIEYSDAENTVHLLAWGPIPFLGEGLPTIETLKAVKEANGFVVLAHPSRRDAWRLFENEWKEYLNGVEIWNRKADGWAPSRSAPRLLGRTGLPPFASLDFHDRRQFFPLKMALNIRGTLSENSILEALRDQRFDALVFGIRLNIGALTPLFGALHLLELGRRCLATGYKKIRGLRATALEPVRAMPKTSQSQTGASTKGSNNGRHKC